MSATHFARGPVVGYLWTRADDATLRRAYAAGGIYAALEALPGRTRGAIYHRANRLCLTRRRRWTRRDDLRLTDLWHEGLPLSTIARELGRSKLTTYWRAQQIGLGLGCPPGFEYLAGAARRTGFATRTLRRILAAAGVRVRRAVTRGNGGGRPHHIVVPEDVDDAVAAWLDSEPLECAARRLGMTSAALAWRLAAVGVERPGRVGKAHWRVRTEDVERAAGVVPLCGYRWRERKAA